jgi:hypothetical protein
MSLVKFLETYYHYFKICFYYFNFFISNFQNTQACSLYDNYMYFEGFRVGFESLKNNRYKKLKSILQSKNVLKAFKGPKNLLF